MLHPRAPLHRRALLGRTAALALVGLHAGAESALGLADQEAEPGAEDLVSFPLQPPSLVAQVVGKSHFDASAVAALVEQRPDLAKAAVDWGFGDWETALGAASHVGRRDIAELLMVHGARPDLFTMAMLGWTDAVRAAIGARPALARVRGPHGLTLAHHARVGGDEAAGTADYLATVEGADEPVATEELDEATLERCLGRYRFAPGADGVAVVEAGRARPMLRREGGTARGLAHQGGGVFRPAGTEAVLVTFAGIEEGPARSLAVHAPAPVVVAARV